MMRREPLRVAVIGGGVAGLGAAYALRSQPGLALYEKEPRAGGHAWTVDVDHGGEAIAVDVGFIVFNGENYPNLSALFAHLGVETLATDMSFSVSDPNGYEWSSDPLGLFAWKRNLVDHRFIALLQEIIRFNGTARAHIAAGDVPDLSLGDYLDLHGFSERFRCGYLLPMGAAIWSTPEREMLAYPASSFISFFDNHRLMHAKRPQWRTVAGGSRSYVRKLVAALPAGALRHRAATRVYRATGGRVGVVDAAGGVELYDRVILAAHADQSRALLDESFAEQRLALGSVRFSSNSAWLHRDERLMPRRRGAWASWNVRKNDDERVCVTYWMNRLQKLPKQRPLFVTLNPVVEPQPDTVFARFEFEHPMFDAASAAARRALQRIQGQDGLHFAGAWLGDGFHEAGLRTGLEAALAAGGEAPWSAVAAGAVAARRPAPVEAAPERAAVAG
jgi:hypothetical protein